MGINVIPLGGLSEIGLNCTVIEDKSNAILIDAGLMFPEEDMLGVDLVIPDFTYVYENASKFRGLFLTHAHEDHVGAVPYLLEKIKLPVYGTKFTLGILQKKLDEFKINDVDLVEIEAKKIYKIGNFKIEPILMTHSIIGGVGFAIETSAGIILHTGDFKIDQTPVDGKPIDLARLAYYGEKGVKLLLSDSTNALNEGFTKSEKKVGEAFYNIFKEVKGRVIVVTFASNIHRVQQIIDVASLTDKKVCIMGKSMVRNTSISKELGFLKDPKNCIIEESQLSDYPDNKLIIVTTGSQGEPMSGLSRIASKEHQKIKVKPTDTFIISAKPIPGNEKAVYRIINTLLKEGAIIYHDRNSQVHVSGHASKDELKILLGVVKPKYFIPIHGEYMMRMAHRDIAIDVGINKENIFMLDNGDVFELNNNVKATKKVPAGRVFVDGKGVGDVEDVVIRDRMQLSTDGFVIVILAFDSSSGELISGPDIITKGLTYEERSKKLINEATSMVKNLVNQCDLNVRMDSLELKKKIRKALNKFLYKKLMRNPMVLPIIMEV
ncbi:MAG: ribonuclease J [Desulfurella sp.]|uniref:ribonuclease J n=1 Tax=Desulfurella sp. TaxID=1962857 RepID=UPI003D0F063B